MSIMQAQVVIENQLQVLFGQNHGFPFQVLVVDPKQIILQTNFPQQVICATMTIKTNSMTSKRLRLNFEKMQSSSVFASK